VSNTFLWQPSDCTATCYDWHCWLLSEINMMMMMNQSMNQSVYSSSMTTVVLAVPVFGKLKSWVESVSCYMLVGCAIAMQSVYLGTQSWLLCRFNSNTNSSWGTGTEVRWRWWVFLSVNVWFLPVQLAEQSMQALVLLQQRCPSVCSSQSEMNKAVVMISSLTEFLQMLGLSWNLKRVTPSEGIKRDYGGYKMAIFTFRPLYLRNDAR